MLATLVEIHSWMRWLVLIAVVAGALFGFLRHRARAAWSRYVPQAEVMVVDIQVAIGLSIWVFFDGWNHGLFFAVFHPLMMLSALAILHVGSALAARRRGPSSWLLMGRASVGTLVLMVAAVPWDRL